MQNFFSIHPCRLPVRYEQNEEIKKAVVRKITQPPNQYQDSSFGKALKLGDPAAGRFMGGGKENASCFSMGDYTDAIRSDDPNESNRFPRVIFDDAGLIVTTGLK